MPLVKITEASLTGYSEVGADSRIRFQAGDASLSQNEIDQMAGLAAAMKAAGCMSPIDILLDAARSPMNQRVYADYAAGEQPGSNI